MYCLILVWFFCSNKYSKEMRIKIFIYCTIESKAKHLSYLIYYIYIELKIFMWHNEPVLRQQIYQDYKYIRGWRMFSITFNRLMGALSFTRSKIQCRPFLYPYEKKKTEYYLLNQHRHIYGIKNKIKKNKK